MNRSSWPSQNPLGPKKGDVGSHMVAVLWTAAPRTVPMRSTAEAQYPLWATARASEREGQPIQPTEPLMSPKEEPEVSSLRAQTLCQPPMALLASSLVPSGAIFHIASSRSLNTHLSRSVPYTDLHWLPTTLRTKIPIMTLSIHALIPAHPCSHVPHSSLSSCF